jgi:hypothetical protein
MITDMEPVRALNVDMERAAGGCPAALDKDL